MIRIFDIIFSLIGITCLFPILFLITVTGFFDTGSPFILQQRVGLKLKKFTLIKFRTMKIGTLEAGTHLINSSRITNIGFILRKFKLDELPQLWNVLIGDMSIVGPRPCLSNQKDLIKERKKLGIYNFKPGITGLAQISGIDMSKPKVLAKTDLKMTRVMNLYRYFYYILLTLFSIIFGRTKR